MRAQLEAEAAETDRRALSREEAEAEAEAVASECRGFSCDRRPNLDDDDDDDAAAASAAANASGTVGRKRLRE